jgi:hypothetical protein
MDVTYNCRVKRDLTYNYYIKTDGTYYSLRRKEA